MITICRGRQDQIHDYFNSFNNEGQNNKLVLNYNHLQFATSSYPISWVTCRLMLGALEKIDKRKFTLLVQKNQVALAMIYDSVRCKLNSSDRVVYSKIAATHKANLSHNYFVQQPFIDAWVKLFHHIGSIYNVTVMLPNINTIDGPSLTIIKKYAAAKMNGGLNFMLGYSEGIFMKSKEIYKYDQNLDKNGLAWGYTKDGVESFLFSAKLIPTTTEIVLDIPSDRTAEVDSGKLRECCYSSIDNDYGWIENLLEGSTSKNTSNLLGNICTEITRSFSAFDFDCALSLGSYAIALDEFNKGTVANYSDVMHTIGLSVHNRQFQSYTTDVNTNKFKIYCFEQALEYESDELAKGYLMYRLAVVSGRKMKNFDQGLYWANLLDHLCADKLTEKWKLLHSWCLNLRAYLHVGTKNKTAANLDITTAFELIYPIARSSENLDREEIYTASLVADNAATLADLSKDLLLGKYWLHKSDEIIGKYSGNRLHAPKAWFKVHNRMTRPDLALKAVLIGLQSANTDFHPFLKDLYITSCGVTHLKLGQYDESIKRLNEAKELHKLFGDQERLKVGNELLLIVEIERGVEEDTFAQYDILSKMSEGDDNLKRSLSLYRLIIDRKKDMIVEDNVNVAIDYFVKYGDSASLAYFNLVLSECLLIGEAYRDQSDDCVSNAEDNMKDVARDHEYFTFLQAKLHIIKSKKIVAPCVSVVSLALEYMSIALTESMISWTLMPHIVAELDRLNKDQLSAVVISGKPFANVFFAISERADLIFEYTKLAQDCPNIGKLVSEFKLLTDGTLGDGNYLDPGEIKIRKQDLSLWASVK